MGYIAQNIPASTRGSCAVFFDCGYDYRQRAVYAFSPLLSATRLAFVMPLHRLRHYARHLLGRWVLLWFALSVGAAMAAPLVHPQAMDIVCTSAGGIKLVVKGDDSAIPVGTSHFDCALCLPLAAPPPHPQVSVAPSPEPLHHATQPVPAARIAAAARAPLPARGPPSAL